MLFVVITNVFKLVLPENYDSNDYFSLVDNKMYYLLFDDLDIMNIIQPYR